MENARLEGGKMGTSKIRTMEEFAAVSGISRPTVSKYFHDPGSVRESTRLRIEAALEEYDYSPNIYAMNQNRRLTRSIGIMVPNLADPFFAEIARNIEGLVNDAGYRSILVSSHEGPRHEVDNFDSLRSLRPAGVLLAPVGRASDKDAVAAFVAEIPTVLFDSNIEGLGDAFVGHDNKQATEIMVEYLVRTGEPPVFFEMRHPPNPNAYKRQKAYTGAMQALGFDPQFIQIEGEGWDFEEIGYAEGMRVIAERRLPSDTILCSNDRLAIGLLAAAYEKGWRVGRGSGFALRIAGHDDHPFARFTSPSLTTTAQNYTEIARHAVKTLFSLVESRERAQERETTLFDGRLVMRASA